MGMTKMDKRSVSLPPQIAADIDERVGKGGFSAYIAEAAAEQLRRDALHDLNAELEAEHGPVDPAEVEALRERFGG